MEDLVQILSALLTPAIAVIAAYIAFQQYRLAKFKVRHELFERRIAVYKAVVEYLSGILFHNGSAGELAARMIRETADAYFLFEKEMNDYLQLLYAKGIDLWALNEELSDRSLSKVKRKTKEAARTELKKWFAEQQEIAAQKFRHYLALSSRL